jgi:hypothetical protein
MFLFATATLSVEEALRHWARSPAVMASHFDVAGRPNGYLDRDAFFAIQLITTGLVALVCGAGGPLADRLPISVINLPHKDFWLAPLRRAATLERLGSALEVQGGATLLLLTLVFDLATAANFRPDRRFAAGLFWPALLLYGVFLLAWSGLMLKTFARPPGE